MREIEINGVKIEIRGLRLSEVSAKKMRSLGYGRFAFKPKLDEEDPEPRLSEIMDAALLAVLGPDGVERVDAAGGVKGLQRAWQAIMAATYGTDDELKNSPAAGSGSPTPGGSNTAAPAAETPKNAEPAKTADARS